MLIDTHSHLDMQDFDQDREKVIKRAIHQGVTHVITVGIDLTSSIRAVHLAEAHGCVYAAVGCHPHHADHCDASVTMELAKLASHPKVVAWGEIGLDFYRNKAAREDQLESFQRQLEAARDQGIPVVIHDREAHGEVLEILRRIGEKKRAGVIHCFSGNLELANRFIQLGYSISIAGTVTFPQARWVKEVAASVPLDAMLLETDAPFLSPVPKRGKRNEPGFVSFTAQEVARLRKVDVEVVAQATSRNAMRLFKIPEST